MANGILYIEYEDFELEGVPPYVSRFTPLDRRQRVWVDTNDGRRFRSETYFRTREALPREGIETYETATGKGGIDKRCDFYDGKAECQQQPITDTLTFDDWLKRATRQGQQKIANKDNPKANEGYTYKGIQQDSAWGDVYVFERDLTITSPDTTRERPAKAMLVIDMKLLRTIEMRRILVEGDKQTLFELYRLKTWKMLDPASVPADLFNPERVPSGKFDP